MLVSLLACCLLGSTVTGSRRSLRASLPLRPPTCHRCSRCRSRRRRRRGSRSARSSPRFPWLFVRSFACFPAAGLRAYTTDLRAIRVRDSCARDRLRGHVQRHHPRVPVLASDVGRPLPCGPAHHPVTRRAADVAPSPSRRRAPTPARRGAYRPARRARVSRGLACVRAMPTPPHGDRRRAHCPPLRVGWLPQGKDRRVRAMTPSCEFDAIESELAEITAELDRLDAARASLMQRLIELGRRVRELSPSSGTTPN